jgi:hypothetical protein
MYTSADYAVYNLLGVGTSSSKKYRINNTKPDGKLLQGSLFYCGGYWRRMLNLIIR